MVFLNLFFTFAVLEIALSQEPLVAGIYHQNDHYWMLFVLRNAGYCWSRVICFYKIQVSNWWQLMCNIIDIAFASQLKKMVQILDDSIVSWLHLLSFIPIIKA